MTLAGVGIVGLTAGWVPIFSKDTFPCFVRGEIPGVRFLEASFDLLPFISRVRYFQEITAYFRIGPP